MEIKSRSEAVRVFIETHVLIGQSSLAWVPFNNFGIKFQLNYRIVLETSPKIRREVQVPKRRRRSTNQNSDLIAFVNLTDEEVKRIKKSGID